MTKGRRCTVAVHVADRAAHAVPVEASATVLVAGAGRRRRERAGLDAERLAAVALDGGLRLALAARPLERIVTGAGRAGVLDEVRGRVAGDLEPAGLVVLGLWLGEIVDPTGHLGHWSTVREAVVSAGSRVRLAVAERDAVVAEQALAAQGWAAWGLAGVLREQARGEVGASAARAAQAPALASTALALLGARSRLRLGAGGPAPVDAAP